MLFCQAFCPINENTSRHTSLVSNVENCWHPLCDIWHLPDPCGTLISWPECCVTASFSTILEARSSQPLCPSKGHPASFQRFPSYCVFRRQRARDNLSFNVPPRGNTAIHGGGGGAPPCSLSHLPESVPPSAILCGLRGSQTFSSQHWPCAEPRTALLSKPLSLFACSPSMPFLFNF